MRMLIVCLRWKVTDLTVPVSDTSSKSAELYDFVAHFQIQNWADLPLQNKIVTHQPTNNFISNTFWNYQPSQNWKIDFCYLTGKSCYTTGRFCFTSFFSCWLTARLMESWHSYLKSSWLAWQVPAERWLSNVFLYSFSNLVYCLLSITLVYAHFGSFDILNWNIESSFNPKSWGISKTSMRILVSISADSSLICTARSLQGWLRSTSWPEPSSDCGPKKACISRVRNNTEWIFISHRFRNNGR